MTTKVCTRCKKEKNEDEFGLRSSVKHGLVPRSYCLACEKEYNSHAHRARLKGNPESIKLAKRRTRLAAYGIAPEEADEMGEAQGWKCYICGADIFKEFHIDHDHSTGVVRKLLCFHCNVALGHFYDSVELLEKAIAYLKEHHGGQSTKVDGERST